MNDTSLLWSLRSPSHTCEAVVRLLPNGLELAIVWDGRENRSFVFKTEEELQEWARWERERLEAEGWKADDLGVRNRTRAS